MTRGLADTSVFIAQESGRPLRTESVPDELAVSVVTVGELRAGVLGAVDLRTRDRRLATLTAVMQLDPLAITLAVAEAWAQLRLLLRARGARMPVNDSWIAATAIAADLPVVTQDEDYIEIDGLRVIRV